MIVNRQNVAEAVERRLAGLRITHPTRSPYMAHDDEHSLRQEVRKMIDRDIIGNNKLELAICSLEAVWEIARNILAHPNEAKYRRFRRENRRIRELIIIPKGALELVVYMGFHEMVEDFEPQYKYEGRTYTKLRVVASIIEEVVARERKKLQVEESRREKEKEELEAHLQQLRAHFMDDRKSVAARVQRERSLPPEKGIPARKKGAAKKANIMTIHGLSNENEAS